MRGPELLLLCVAVLYLVECVAVVRPDEVLFERTRGRWRERNGGMLLGGLGVSLVLTDPLTFGSTHLIARRSAPLSRRPEPAGVRAALLEAEDVLAPLRADGAFLAAFVFLLAPLMVRLTNLAHAWLPLVLGGGVLVGCAIMDFRRAQNALMGGQGGSWSTVVTLLFSPAAAMRAHRLFARELVHECHPLVLARAICDEVELRRLAAAELRQHGEDAEVVRFLMEAGSDPGELREPPRDRDGAARSYCPRCLGQYSLESGQCADCEEVALARFPEVSAA